MSFVLNSSTTTSLNTGANSKISKNLSYRLPGGPKDGISHISWSVEPNTCLLSCGSWDNSVLIWEITNNFDNSLAAVPKCMFSLSAPVLTSCFASSNSKLFAGGCDKMVKLFDLNSGNSEGQQVAQHDQPICKAIWCDSLNTLITASWDGYVRMWDGKSSNPVWQHNCGSKILTMDMKNSYLAVSDSKREITIWNILQMDKSQKIISPLKMMTKSLAVNTDSEKNPFVIIGSIEGRCSIAYIDKNLTKKNFSFRCHRRNNEIYAINSIDFYSSKGIFVTCGSDATVVIWHLEQKQRLKTFVDIECSVVDVRFNPVMNNLLAYAVSYDWHKGLDQEEIKKSSNAVYLHMLTNDDLKLQAKQQTNSR